MIIIVIACTQDIAFAAHITRAGRLRLGCFCHTFADDGAGGATHPRANDGARFAAGSLADCGACCTTHCAADYCPALAGAAGADGCSCCASYCAADYGARFAADRLSDYCACCRANAAANGRIGISGKACGSRKKRNECAGQYVNRNNSAHGETRPFNDVLR